MSLVITTSKLQENPSEIGTEKPAHYTNHFRSPLEIEPDSEIALESIKINRSGNVAVPPNMYYNHYFGEDPQDRIDDAREGVSYQLNYPTRVNIPEGSYDLEEFRRQVQNAFDAQYSHPALWRGHTATIHTNASGLEQGIELKWVNASSASGTNSRAYVGDAPYYNIKHPGGAGESGAYDYSLATGVFERTAAAVAAGVRSADTQAVGILTDKPFGLNRGKLTFDVDGASGGEFTCVGLTRPKLQYDVYTNPNPDARVFRKNMDPNGWQKNNNFYRYRGASGNTPGFEVLDQSPKFHMDYGVLITNDSADADGHVYIFHSLAGYPIGTGPSKHRHYEIKYWESGGTQTNGRMTNASFKATYDGVWNKYFSK